MLAAARLLGWSVDGQSIKLDGLTRHFADIPQGMNTHDFGDPLTFPIGLPAA